MFRNAEAYAFIIAFVWFMLCLVDFIGRQLGWDDDED